jgi:hypothetical protein
MNRDAQSAAVLCQNFISAPNLRARQSIDDNRTWLDVRCGIWYTCAAHDFGTVLLRALGSDLGKHCVILGAVTSPSRSVLRPLLRRVERRALVAAVRLVEVFVCIGR